MYDRKYNQVAENSKAGLIPFEKLDGFNKKKQERKVHPTPAVVQRNLHPIMHKPQKSAMAGSIEETDDIGPPKLVTQKQGFPYDKYHTKFQRTFEQRLKEELERNGDSEKIMNSS